MVEALMHHPDMEGDESRELLGNLERFDIDTGQACWVLSLFEEYEGDESLHVANLLLQREGLNAGASNVIAIRPGQNISKSLLTGWIEDCNEYHVDCHGFGNPWLQIPPTSGLWFIDVKRLCLVRNLPFRLEHRMWL